MQQRLKALATNYEQAYLKRFPELGLFWGRQDIPLDRFTDNTIEAVRAWEDTQDEFLQQLSQIDETQLDDMSEGVTYQLLKQSIESDKACRQCKDELWQLDPLFGWHIKIGLIAEKQPLDDQALRKTAIARFRTVPALLDNEIKNLKEGIEAGYTAPKPIVERIINQLEIMLNYQIKDNPVYTLAKRHDASDFINDVTMMIESEINPTFQRYCDFLKNTYLTKARDSIGLSALPNGKSCYQAKILRETTLNITPEEIHQFGLSRIEQISQEIKTIGKRLFGLNDVRAIFKQIKTESEFLFTSEKEVIDYNLSALERVRAVMPKWFVDMPKADCTITPYPIHRAKTGAPGEYHPPSEDGTRPGIYYINTYQADQKARADQEATLFHELIPGHHYQIALSQEDKSHHSLDKLLWNCGYGEGWALYSERLAQEMGLYSDDIAILGMLSNEALRAARLVVDPGIHYFGWSRDKAINYLKQYTTFDDHIIESEVDRYIMLPGQATAYMLGQKVIFELRANAEDQLDKAFDIRQFHRTVLQHGAITLPMLKAQVKSWMDQNT